MELHIYSALVEALNERCECNFTASHIKAGVFSCYQAASDYNVIYRSTIVGIQKFSAHDLLELIGEWVEIEPIILLDERFILRLSSRCPVDIASLHDPECLSTPMCECVEGPPT